MAVRVVPSITELQALVGTELGVSDWLEITQERVNLFADATGDHQWIHVDPERAAEGTFGGTIAHGYLTLSLIPAFTAEVYRVENLVMAINYGSNTVRFVQPVLVGSRIRDRVVLDEVTETARGYQVFLTHTIEFEGIEKPACIAQTIAVVVPE